MNKFCRKLLTISLVSSLALGGTLIWGDLGVPIISEVAAYSPVEALISGGAAMAYVTKALGQMDNTDKGQQESFERTKKETGYYENATAQKRVQTILTNLSKSPLVKRKYIAYVNPDEDFNAFMTIGRVMSINKGALDKLDDSELAYVMAHEMSHGEHKDVVNGLKKQIGLSTAINVAAAGASSGAAASMSVLRTAYGDHYREGLAQVLAPNNHPKTSNRVLANNERMYTYSNAHVSVQGSTVYVNGQNIYTPTAKGRYTSEERAYLMAGKLARLYHNSAVAPDWASYKGTEVLVGSTSIVNTETYSSAQSVAETLNKAFSSVNNQKGLIEDSGKKLTKAERKKAKAKAKDEKK